MRQAVLILCVIGLTFGCAYSHNKFYYPDGTPCAVTKSTVIGTGDIEKYVKADPCGLVESYDTKGTGTSDNFTELGGKVAEGLTKGAAKGLMPLP